jgi:hypothetical protein
MLIVNQAVGDITENTTNVSDNKEWMKKKLKHVDKKNEKSSKIIKCIFDCG